MKTPKQNKKPLMQISYPPFEPSYIPYKSNNEKFQFLQNQNQKKITHLKQMLEFINLPPRQKQYTPEVNLIKQTIYQNQELNILDNSSFTSNAAQESKRSFYHDKMDSFYLKQAQQISKSIPIQKDEQNNYHHFYQSSYITDQKYNIRKPTITCLFDKQKMSNFTTFAEYLANKHPDSELYAKHQNDFEKVNKSFDYGFQNMKRIQLTPQLNRKFKTGNYSIKNESIQKSQIKQLFSIIDKSIGYFDSAQTCRDQFSLNQKGIQRKAITQRDRFEKEQLVPNKIKLKSLHQKAQNVNQTNIRNQFNTQDKYRTQQSSDQQQTYRFLIIPPYNDQKQENTGRLFPKKVKTFTNKKNDKKVNILGNQQQNQIGRSISLLDPNRMFHGRRQLLQKTKPQFEQDQCSPWKVLFIPDGSYLNQKLEFVEIDLNQ